MKNLVILSGGGFKAAYQVGALKALIEKNISIDCIMGTSGGALNASIVAQGDYIKLESIWNNISSKGISSVFESELLNLNPQISINWGFIFKKLVPKLRLNLLSKSGRQEFINSLFLNIYNINSLCTSKGLETLLSSNIRKQNFIIPFYTNFVSLNTGEEVIVSNTDFYTNSELTKAILASSSIPFFLNSQEEIRTKEGIYLNCVDGGISSNVLIHKAVDFIKNSVNPLDWRIIVLNCNSTQNLTLNIKGIPKILERVILDILLSNLTKKEFKLLETYNEFLDSTYNKTFKIKGNNYYKIPFIHIHPQSVELGETLTINEDINNYRIKKGYEDTIKFFK